LHASRTQKLLGSGLDDKVIHIQKMNLKSHSFIFE